MSYQNHISIDKIESENIDFELIICDDASTDDSMTFLKTNFPEIKILKVLL